MSAPATAGHPTNTRAIMASVLLVLLLVSLDQLVAATAMPKIIASLQGFSALTFFRSTGEAPLGSRSWEGS